MTESDLQTAVIDTARMFGWRVAHFRPAQTSKGWRTPVAADGKGFPDLVLVNGERGQLIFAELKAAKGRTSPEQDAWLTDLTAVAEAIGKTVYRPPAAFRPMLTVLWTPQDWPDRIVKTLSGRPAKVKAA